MKKFQVVIWKQLAKVYEGRKIKGEIVIVIGAPALDEVIDIDGLLIELMQTMSTSRAAAEAANLSGKSKRDLYQRALKLGDSVRWVKNLKNNCAKRRKSAGTVANGWRRLPCA